MIKWMEFSDLVSYGLGPAFDCSKFKPIVNRPFCKPHGGLWASPVNSRYNWYAWCMDNKFRPEALREAFAVSVSGLVLVVDCYSDLYDFHWYSPDVTYHSWVVPDFEDLVRRGVDAVYLTNDGQWATRLSRPRDLYGWDCECVLVLNPNCVTPVSGIQIPLLEKAI